MQSTYLVGALFAAPLLLAACGGSAEAPAAGAAAAAAVAAPPLSVVETACADNDVSPGIPRAIEGAMATGSSADVAQAIGAARAALGLRIGCPEALSARTAGNFTRPELSAVRARWTDVHAAALSTYRISCPEIGRGAPSAALGAFAALAVGAPASRAQLTDIARMVEAQQYTVARGGQVVDTSEGVFGGIVASGRSDPCALTGVPGEVVQQWCARFAEQCVTYASGQFAGRRFLVADINRAAGVYDGGIGFDQGWSGVMMLAAAQAETDDALRTLFQQSASLAGAWSAAEPPVRNHNYTAKNIWLLARLYGQTGETRWRSALLDKLERNLLPGVLMDANGDGLTDAPGPQLPFAQLAPVAQVPGRMWDLHNAVTHYQGMNTVAMVEAYVALRDRDDRAEAARVRPYALAMLDNLAREFTQLGLPASSASQREAGIALVLGAWKIALPERLARPDWDRAIDAVYNGPTSRNAGAGTVAAGLYLAYRTDVAKVPLP
jgi:hypothetical protein